MKRFLVLILYFFIAVSTFSQNITKNKYSGGMLVLQLGYTYTANRHQNIHDVSFGLGGILRFYFYDFLTAGIYGGTQKTKYSSTNSGSSYLNLGYGGPFIGISRKAGKLRYSISAFAGKGTIRNLHIESQNNNTLTEAYLYKNSTMVYSPIICLDYALSQVLNLTFQTTMITAKSDNNKLYNPTFQMGVLFSR
ncbi:MAG: hypothetical protein MUC93_01265 [Bacteroidales bacterium]|jgi:hypothetical protein|nr:hypothetical protein [Bacteroidales bacterium]